MAKLSLFQVAALLHPVKNSKGEYKGDTQIIVKPKFQLAKNGELAAKLILKKLPDEYDDRLEDVEIIVRPF